MKLDELLEAQSEQEYPLIWRLVKQRLDKGEKVFVRGGVWTGPNRPDFRGIFPLTKVGDTGGTTEMPIIYFKPPGHYAETWVEVLPEDDDKLELVPMEAGAFLLQYIDPKKWIAS